ncbi:MAG TPA: CDP-diacylglycerol--glycerol-3-phosphate 3-phosphatidyltransferase [Chthoniobacterales bacterium]
MLTLANRITLFRIFLVPVFVMIACYYGQSVDRGEPKEWMRYTALGVFLVASLSDGIDGFIARRFNQISKLGVILDPIADKGLLLAALITLAVANWEYELPIWFVVLVIARDVVVVTGTALLHVINGNVHIKPSVSGKIATMLQMIAISWTMLQLPNHLWPIFAAGGFVLVSGIGYILDGLRQLSHPPAASAS